MTVPVYDSVDAVEAAKGVELGPTDWLVVEQRRIDQFADATEDHQWIHVDPDRAASGPFGTTIAHGFLTLSLLPHFVNQLRRMENVRMGINYGLNKVRFPAPVPVGSRLRARTTMTEVQRLAEDAVQIVSAVTIDIEGSDKPGCVAESVVRIYFGS